jgi:hypothetical protein
MIDHLILRLGTYPQDGGTRPDEFTLEEAQAKRGQIVRSRPSVQAVPESCGYHI